MRLIVPALMSTYLSMLTLQQTTLGVDQVHKKWVLICTHLIKKITTEASLPPSMFAPLQRNVRNHGYF